MLSEAKHLRLIAEQTLRFAQGDSQRRKRFLKWPRYGKVGGFNRK